MRMNDQDHISALLREAERTAFPDLQERQQSAADLYVLEWLARKREEERREREHHADE